MNIDKNCHLVKFASQMDNKLLQELKHLAKKENKQLQHFFNEAVMDLLHKYDESQPKTEVLQVSRNIRAKFANTFKELAK